MTHDPKIEDWPERRYIGIRQVMPMSAFEREIPTLIRKAADWLESNGSRPSGRPFLRYHTIDMPERMDVELGIPVHTLTAPSGDVTNGVLPAGRYVTLIYVGAKHGIEANKRLLDWIGDQGEAVMSQLNENGEAFEARLKTYLSEGDATLAKQNVRTQVAVKLRN